MRPRERDHHKAKIAWVAVSVPTVLITELEGALLIGILLTVAGWAFTMLRG